MSNLVSLRAAPLAGRGGRSRIGPPQWPDARNQAPRGEEIIGQQQWFQRRLDDHFNLGQWGLPEWKATPLSNALVISHESSGTSA